MLRFRPKLDSLDTRIVPATLRVDDDLGQFPTAKYQTVQAAINDAAPGDTVLVYPGTYAEKLTVGAGKNNLVLRSQTPLAATLSLPASAPAYSAILTIGTSTGVDVNGFTIGGAGAFPGQVYDGLEVNQKASVNVRNNLFRDIGDARGDSGEPQGGQTGIAVYVGADGGGVAVIRNNTFVRYQKAGVVVDGPSSSATVTDNTFAGAGPTANIAQIGIQFSQNGGGTVTNNLITGHIYTGPEAATLPLVTRPGDTPQVNPRDNPLSAAGVVVYQAQAVTVSKNSVLANQTGVYVSDMYNTAVISKNTIAGSTLDGINLDLARGGVVVTQNQVPDSGRDGIHLMSNSHGNTISRNTVTGSGRFGIASVPYQYGPEAYDVVAPAGNVIAGNTVTGSLVFDLFAQSAPGTQGGDAINDIWAGNTFGTRNRPGLR